MKSKEAEEYKGFETDNFVTEIFIKHYKSTGKQYIYASYLIEEGYTEMNDFNLMFAKAINNGELYYYKKGGDRVYSLTPKLINILRRNRSMIREFDMIAEEAGRDNLHPEKLSKLAQNIIKAIFENEQICTTKIIAKKLHQDSDKVRRYANRLKKIGYVKRFKCAWELSNVGHAYIQYFLTKKQTSSEVLKVSEK
jgi:hypothetical protein